MKANVTENEIVENVVVSLCEKTEDLCTTDDVQNTLTEGLITCETVPLVTTSNTTHHHHQTCQTIDNGIEIDVEKTKTISNFISECYLSPNVKTSSSVSTNESLCMSVPCDAKDTNKVKEIEIFKQNKSTSFAGSFFSLPN